MFSLSSFSGGWNTLNVMNKNRIKFSDARFSWQLTTLVMHPEEFSISLPWTLHGLTSLSSFLLSFQRLFSPWDCCLYANNVMLVLCILCNWRFSICSYQTLTSHYWEYSLYNNIFNSFVTSPFLTPSYILILPLNISFLPLIMCFSEHKSELVQVRLR